MSETAARRILVIANETLAEPDVVQAVAARAAGTPADVLVVAPALPRSRLAHMLGTDVQRAREAAGARLESTVEALERAGLDATGQLGDGDPMQALDDAVRTFRPDEIVIATHPPERSGWLERDIVSRARARHRIPITHLVVEVGTGLRSVDAPPLARHGIVGRVTLYHGAGYDEALTIRRRGFRDRPLETGGSGVTVADVPDAAGDDDGHVVLAVEVPEDLLAGRAVDEDGTTRRYVLPAELLNRYGPPVTVGDWSE